MPIAISIFIFVFTNIFVCADSYILKECNHYAQISNNILDRRDVFLFISFENVICI